MGQKGDENVDFKVKEAPPNRLATEPSVLLDRSEANVKRKKELNNITHAAMETGTFKVKSCKKNTALKANVLKDRFFQH